MYRMNTIAKYVKTERKKAGLTQEEFAIRSGLGLRFVRELEQGKETVRIEDKPASRSFGLSDAYDLLPVNVIMPEDTEQMALALNGKKRNLRKKDFKALASSLEISEKTSEIFMKRLIKLESKFIETIQTSHIPKEMQDSFVEQLKMRLQVLK